MIIDQINTSKVKKKQKMIIDQIKRVNKRQKMIIDQIYTKG